MKNRSPFRRASMAGLILATAFAALAAGTAFAQPHEAWHGDIHNFHEHDWGVWRGGHWYHGGHGGRMGWWWVVGGTFYFYPAPVYPYPSPWEPPAVELVTPPVGSAPPPPPTQYWYYCPPAKSYYPYVPTCPGGWQQVPAQH
jgi:hypothetical protein